MSKNAEYKRAQRERGSGKDEVAIKVSRNVRDSLAAIKDDKGLTWDEILTKKFKLEHKD